MYGVFLTTTCCVSGRRTTQRVSTWDCPLQAWKWAQGFAAGRPETQPPQTYLLIPKPTWRERPEVVMRALASEERS